MNTISSKQSSVTCCPSNLREKAWELVQTLWASLLRRSKQRRDVRHLRGLSDQHLRDIGIRRSEISSVVYGQAADLARMLGLSQK